MYVSNKISKSLNQASVLKNCALYIFLFYFALRYCNFVCACVFFLMLVKDFGKENYMY